MTDPRHDDLLSREPVVDVIDPEVPLVDAQEDRPADPDQDIRPTLSRAVPDDAEVPVADAWEQAQPVDVYDDY